MQLVRLLDGIYQGLVILSTLMCPGRPRPGFWFLLRHSECSEESLLHLGTHDPVDSSPYSECKIKELSEGTTWG